MHEQVTVVVRVPHHTDEEIPQWEVVGIYRGCDDCEDAQNAIDYFTNLDIENDTPSVYGRVTMPVLAFPKWVR